MSISHPTPADIKAFRAAMGLSQVALASALGVSRRTVEEWEKDGGNQAPAFLRYAFAAINHGLDPWEDRIGRV